MKLNLEVYKTILYLENNSEVKNQLYLGSSIYSTWFQITGNAPTDEELYKLYDIIERVYTSNKVTPSVYIQHCYKLNSLIQALATTRRSLLDEFTHVDDISQELLNLIRLHYKL